MPGRVNAPATFTEVCGPTANRRGCAVPVASISAPSAGPPPWWVYRVTPRRATVLQTVEPGGATLFEFDAQ